MKICLIGDYLLTRCAYVYALKQIKGVESVADFNTLGDCENYLNKTGADVVLIDVVLDEVELKSIKHIKENFCGVKFIIMAKQEDVLPVLALGAAYVLKNVKMEEFAEIITTVLQGNLFIAADIANFITSIFAEKVEQKNQIKSYKLTPRELEVLQRISLGESNIEIGSHLFLSQYTVKNYVSRIIEKMGVKDRTQAATKAIQYGLV